MPTGEIEFDSIERIFAQRDAKGFLQIAGITQGFKLFCLPL